MMSKILAVLKQSIKTYNIQSGLDSEDALVTLLAADIYKSLVFQSAETTMVKPRRKKEESVIDHAAE